MNEYDNRQFINLECVNEEYKNLYFTDCEFINCIIDSCKFINCTFADCTFTNCRIINNSIQDSQMRYSVFNSCCIIGLNWGELTEINGLSQPFDIINNCRLKYNNFVEMNLIKFNFSGCDITESLFGDCRLANSSFKGCDLSSTEFFRCDLTKLDFRDAQGYIIDVTANKLKNACFSLPDAVNLLMGLGIKID